MAEQIKKIEIELHTYQFGVENGLITQQEYNELTSIIVCELKALAKEV